MPTGDKHEKPCPNCGHCPTCGRSNFKPNPWYPYPWGGHGYPWTTTPYRVTWGSGTSPNQSGASGGYQNINSAASAN